MALIHTCPVCGGRGNYGCARYSGDLAADREWNAKQCCLTCNGTGRVVIEKMRPFAHGDVDERSQWFAHNPRGTP